jgi:hypothetical protein
MIDNVAAGQRVTQGNRCREHLLRLELYRLRPDPACPYIQPYYNRHVIQSCFQLAQHFVHKHIEYFLT